MENRGAWLKADPEAARLMGKKGGKASAAKRVSVRSPEYCRGYDNGWRVGFRHGQAVAARALHPSPSIEDAVAEAPVVSTGAEAREKHL